MGNLTDPRWIVAKGLGFLAIGILAAAILLLLAQSWQVACLLALSVWAFCRFYYFAFLRDRKVRRWWLPLRRFTRLYPLLTFLPLSISQWK